MTIATQQTPPITTTGITHESFNSIDDSSPIKSGVRVSLAVFDDVAAAKDADAKELVNFTPVGIVLIAIVTVVLGSSVNAHDPTDAITDTGNADGHRAPAAARQNPFRKSALAHHSQLSAIAQAAHAFSALQADIALVVVVIDNNSVGKGVSNGVRSGAVGHTPPTAAVNPMPQTVLLVSHTPRPASSAPFVSHQRQSVAVSRPARAATHCSQSRTAPHGDPGGSVGTGVGDGVGCGVGDKVDSIIVDISIDVADDAEEGDDVGRTGSTARQTPFDSMRTENIESHGSILSRIDSQYPAPINSGNSHQRHAVDVSFPALALEQLSQSSTLSQSMRVGGSGVGRGVRGSILFDGCDLVVNIVVGVVVVVGGAVEFTTEFATAVVVMLDCSIIVVGAMSVVLLVLDFGVAVGISGIVCVFLGVIEFIDTFCCASIEATQNNQTAAQNNIAVIFVHAAERSTSANKQKKKKTADLEGQRTLQSKKKKNSDGCGCGCWLGWLVTINVR
jgi:hypothetical protein